MIFGNTTNVALALPRERAFHPRPLLAVPIRPSHAQRVVLIGVLALAGFVLWNAHLQWWIALGGSLLMFIYTSDLVRSQRHYAVTHLQLLPDDGLELRCVDEPEAVSAQLLPPLFVSGVCVAIRWKREGVKPRSGALFLTPDQMSTEKFHALRVRLKYLRTLPPTP